VDTTILDTAIAHLRRDGQATDETNDNVGNTTTDDTTDKE
jgi:hypothetical protein